MLFKYKSLSKQVKAEKDLMNTRDLKEKLQDNWSTIVTILDNSEVTM